MDKQGEITGHWLT